MTTTERLLTAEEFFALQCPDDARHELVEGRVAVTPPPGARHSGTAGEVYAALRAFVQQHGQGRVLMECGFALWRDPDTVRAPDVAFVRGDRLEAGELPAGYIEGAPDLAVEVVSPNDTATEIQRKVTEYLRAGSQRVWVVWPEERSVTVHRPDGSAHTYGAQEQLSSDDASFAAEGFGLPVADIFG